MAQNYNIQMSYFNGTDYDTLYPQTKPENILSGTLSSQINANSTSMANLSSSQIRNIYAGTLDMTAGSSLLPSGEIYLYYEN